MRPFRSALIPVFCLLGNLCAGAVPYLPVRPVPLLESWRWHAQERLDGMNLNHAFECGDGSVWFVSESGMVRYDGSSLEHFPAPEGMNLVACRSGAMTRSGRIYMLIPGRIIEFHDGVYREVFSYSGRYDMLMGQAVLTPDDQVLFGTPDGIVAVRAGTARVVSASNRRASYLLLDSRGDLWTNKVSTGQVLRYRDFPLDGSAANQPWESFPMIPETGVHIVLAELPDGSIWSANDNPHRGVFAFDREALVWRPLPIDETAEESVHHSIHVAPDGTVIIYGDKRLLLLREGKAEQLTLDDLRFPSNNPFLLSLRSGSMIIGGRRETVYHVDCSSRWWESYPGLNYFCTDTAGRQWFISFKGEIIARDPATGQWSSHRDARQAINTPLTMIATADGRVWAAGRHDNVAALSVFHNGEWTLFLHPEMGMRISHQSLFATRDGKVLLGSGDTDPENIPGRGGLLVYEPDAGHYTVTHYAPPRVPFRVVGIAEGPDGTLYTGGSRLRRLEDFNAEPLPSGEGFTNGWIDDLIVTGSGELWVGQWGIGVSAFDGQAWITSTTMGNEGAREVVALLDDATAPGQVWAATSNGLYNLERNGWVDEPLSGELSMLREGGSLVQSPDGTLWINASSRNWHFRDTGRMPGSERFEPGFRTTGFRRHDVQPDTRILSFKPEVYEPGLTFLEWTGFCEWSLVQTEQLSYSYRLNGGEWTPFSKRTEVVLGSLANGVHTFEVRSRTPYGAIDATPAAVSFRVIPVLWKRPWFIVATVSLFALLIILALVIVRQRIQHILALEEYKIQFFTNISHELRTPLMVILGPLEALTRHVDDAGRKHLEIALRNARKLFGLVDRLLDFRKAELGKIQTDLQVLDLILFVRQEVEALRPLAEGKAQQLEFRAEAEHLFAAFDPKIVEVILDNLLTNAIKYTPDGGRVEVLIRATPTADRAVELCLEVTDTGPGIPAPELDRVFDPFYQAGGKSRLRAHSTGIGLAHTRSLVEAIGGRVRAESPVHAASSGNPGTRFVVELHLQRGDAPVSAPVPAPADTGDEEEDDESAGEGSGNPLLLIVEDNEDIRHYLEIEFGQSYTVLTAVDGARGLEIARAEIPDLVVSDVLMPVMDGRAFCRELKADPRTSHIPVILLTALKSEAHELAGLETGADDYVTKPVNIALLSRRLENLLNNRRKVREFIDSHTHSIAINKDELPVNRVDQEFVVKFMKTIEDNLTSESFDVESLAKAMFMSRMTLYRKVKALIGRSPGDVIRTVRLKKAAQYFETGSWTVSQVIERVGFLDMSHFSRSFKKEFGCTPTEYIERFGSRGATEPPPSSRS